MEESFGGGPLGSGGAGTVWACGKCSLRETIQPVGVGINVICKVSFTPASGVAVLPEGWFRGAFFSERQSCRSAKVGIGGGEGWLVCGGTWLGSLFIGGCCTS